VQRLGVLRYFPSRRPDAPAAFKGASLGRCTSGAGAGQPHSTQRQSALNFAVPTLTLLRAEVMEYRSLFAAVQESLIGPTRKHRPPASGSAAERRPDPSDTYAKSSSGLKLEFPGSSSFDVTQITGDFMDWRDKGSGHIDRPDHPGSNTMRQLIVAAVTLIALTAASSTLALRSSTLALRSQLQPHPAAHCSALVANPPCPGGGVPLQL
jgi:hypothetical protein